METITIPYHYQPRLYQLELLKAFDSKKYNRYISVLHRRAGKDKTAVNIALKGAIDRIGTYYYFLPTYTQAKKVIWTGADKEGMRFLDHIPKELVKSKNETEMRIDLINGSVIQLVGADNIDRIVGTNPVGVIFSEYSIMKPNVWDFIRPILAENGGWALFIFTPRGMNHAWKLLQQAKESKEWYTQVLGVEDTHAIDPVVLENERKEMPSDLYEQEYNVKFIEGASSFFKQVTENIHHLDLQPDLTHRYRMGVDLAKYQDYTVLTLIDINTFKVHKQERFNQLDYNLQKSRIEATWLRFGKPQVWIDSTGVGEPIYDDLLRMGLNIQPFKFTESSRKDLLQNLSIKIEQGTIKIPNDDLLLNELRSFQYTMTDSGKVRVEVPSGIHDDMVMSLALSVWELPRSPVALEGSLRYLGQLIGKEDNVFNSNSSFE